MRVSGIAAAALTLGSVDPAEDEGRRAHHPGDAQRAAQDVKADAKGTAQEVKSDVKNAVQDAKRNL